MDLKMGGQTKNHIVVCYDTRVCSTLCDVASPSVCVPLHVGRKDYVADVRLENYLKLQGEQSIVHLRTMLYLVSLMLYCRWSWTCVKNRSIDCHYSSHRHAL